MKEGRRWWGWVMLMLMVMVMILGKVKSDSGSQYDAGTQMQEMADIAFGQLVSSNDEYIASIVVAQDGTLAFALIGSTHSYRRKLIVAQLTTLPSVPIAVKTLAQSISRLELVTLDNRYLVTRSFELLRVSDLLSPNLTTVPVSNINLQKAKDEWLSQVQCLKHTNVHSALLVITYSNSVFIVGLDGTVQMRAEQLDFVGHCGGTVASIHEPVLYGLSRNRTRGLSVLEYADKASPQSTLIPISELTDLTDYQQQLVISPHNTFMLFLSTRKVWLFSLGANASEVRLQAIYPSALSSADFVNDHTVIGYAQESSKYLLLHVGPANGFELIAEYKPKMFIGTTYVKVLHNGLVGYGDTVTLKVLLLKEAALPFRSVAWSLYILVFGVVMATVMIVYAVYAIGWKNPTVQDPTAHQQLSDMPLQPSLRNAPALNQSSAVSRLEESSVPTDNLVTDQDLMGNTSALRRTITCPLTLQIMTHPVIASDGHSYDQAAILAWMQDHPISPVTKQRFPNNELVPNYVLDKLIAFYRRQAQGDAP